MNSFVHLHTCPRSHTVGKLTFIKGTKLPPSAWSTSGFSAFSYKLFKQTASQMGWLSVNILRRRLLQIKSRLLLIKAVPRDWSHIFTHVGSGVSAGRYYGDLAGVPLSFQPTGCFQPVTWKLSPHLLQMTLTRIHTSTVLEGWKQNRDSL